MLEKNNKFFTDAHFHLTDCFNCSSFNPPENWIGCTCAHNQNEWYFQYDKKLILKEKIKLSFGFHPQVNYNTDLNFLETLLKENKLDAIGEAGFDFFTPELKSLSKQQEENFIFQTEMAVKYNKPLIIHCRKANEKLFEYSSLLKKVPAVLFHSFMGTLVEAQSLSKKGINAYFSFGKQMMNNNKKVIECVEKLPLEQLLLETDAPFQFLKGEEKTFTGDIEKIFIEASDLRNIEMEILQEHLFENFKNLFK